MIPSPKKFICKAYFSTTFFIAFLRGFISVALEFVTISTELLLPSVEVEEIDVVDSFIGLILFDGIDAFFNKLGGASLLLIV